MTHNGARRSALYMPGANTRALEKAKTINADVLIFDLEDAVAPDAKADARANVCSAALDGGYGHRELCIRINALDTEWGTEDILAAIAAKPAAILAPKVNTSDDIHHLDQRMSEAGASSETALWVMIETPMSILNLKDIAAASTTTRLSGFVVGTNDLAKDLHADTAADRVSIMGASLQMILLAARAYGLTALDGVFNDFKNPEGLRKECEEGAIMGYDGKTLIHPAQVDICNEVFSPSAEAIADAEAIITAFALPENTDKGVITVNGKMTERLHLQQAMRIAALKQAIETS